MRYNLHLYAKSASRSVVEERQAKKVRPMVYTLGYGGPSPETAVEQEPPGNNHPHLLIVSEQMNNTKRFHTEYTTCMIVVRKSEPELGGM
jgi:hypothetical protein